MKYYTYFEVVMYEFLLYSLDMRERIVFNHIFPMKKYVYNDDFDSCFLNKYGYITYENNKNLRKIFN